MTPSEKMVQILEKHMEEKGWTEEQKNKHVNAFCAYVDSMLALDVFEDTGLNIKKFAKELWIMYGCGHTNEELFVSDVIALAVSTARKSKMKKHIVDDDMIFVFGSNLAGLHGAGAAAFAEKYYGAIRGRGVGRSGQSYGIPTKDQIIHTLPLNKVEQYIKRFLQYAIDHPELKFKVTQIGCGLAGFTPIEIAPLFRNAPTNCHFDKAWVQFLGVENRSYWGTVA